VTRLFGDEALAWLAGLPALEADLAARWSLVLGPELAGGRLASVRVARRADGTDAVFEADRPVGPAGGRDRVPAPLGRGPAPRLLAADDERRALLLERILPGTPVTGAPAGQVASLLERIQLEPPVGLPPLQAIVRLRLERAAREGRASSSGWDWAWFALERLEEGAPEPVTVHGDFDERNILRCARRGLWRDRPAPVRRGRRLRRRVWITRTAVRAGARGFEAMAAAAGIDRERLRDWCGVVAVHG